MDKFPYIFFSYWIKAGLILIILLLSLMQNGSALDLTGTKLNVETTADQNINLSSNSKIIVTVTGEPVLRIIGEKIEPKPISEATITLISSPGGKLKKDKGSTGSDGTFSTYFSSSNPGTYTVSVNVSYFNSNSIQDEVQITVNPSIENGDFNLSFILTISVILILSLIGLFIWTRGSLKLLPDQTSIPCDGKSTIPIKIQFANVFGKPRKPKKDCEVKLKTTSGTIRNAIIPAGKEFVQTTLTSSNDCGPVMLTAKSGKQKATAQVNFVSIETGLDVEISPPEIPADSKSTATVTIRVKDDAGNDITSQSERTVELTTTLGTITSPVNIPPETLAGTATITSGQTSGTALVTASIGSLTGEGNVIFEELRRYCMYCGTPMSMEAPKCPKCGKIPPSGVDTKECSTCGAVVPLSVKFCDKCGARQPE